MERGPDLDAEAALERLAAGALRGPAAEAWELFDRSWPVWTRRLAAFLRSLRVPENLREDCGQNALLRVWRSRETYAGRTASELLGWTHRICQREFHRLLEAEGRAPRREGEPDETGGAAEPGDGSDDPATAALASDAERALEECLARLEPRRRAAVELLYAADALSERQVAEVLGLSKSAVNVLRQTSLRDLAACLRGKGID